MAGSYRNHLFVTRDRSQVVRGLSIAERRIEETLDLSRPRLWTSGRSLEDTRVEDRGAIRCQRQIIEARHPKRRNGHSRVRSMRSPRMGMIGSQNRSMLPSLLRMTGPRQGFPCGTFSYPPIYLEVGHAMHRGSS